MNMLLIFSQKPEIMANKHGAAGNEEDDESDEDTSVSLYMIIIYLGASVCLIYLHSLDITIVFRQ